MTAYQTKTRSAVSRTEPQTTDWEQLRDYRCKGCRQRCLNPRDSREAKQDKCRHCTTPEYKRRPDPDEPWRYACPECESFVLTRLGGRECFVCVCGRCWGMDELIDRATVDRRVGMDV